MIRRHQSPTHAQYRIISFICKTLFIDYKPRTKFFANCFIGRHIARARRLADAYKEAANDYIPN